MRIAISPCPNDTFLFYAWIHGIVGFPIDVTFADIDTLNNFAEKEQFPLLKISIAKFRKLKNYTLLPAGMALGYGVGPKVIGLKHFDDFSDKTIAIPGMDTTAHLLFDYFFKDVKKKVFCTYDEVIPLLKQKKVDLGLIIHETRFTFMGQGFFELADLGELWEKKFSLPLPLGGIVLRNDHLENKEAIISNLKKSYLYAKENRSKLHEFIFFHAQEKNSTIVQKHIDLYVTEETFEISSKGKKSIDLLLSL